MQITPIFLLKHYFCIPFEHKDPQIPQKYTRRDRHPCLAVEIVWGVWCISRGQVKRLIWGDNSHCAGFLPARKQISSVLIPETWTARLHYISPRHYTPITDNSALDYKTLFISSCISFVNLTIHVNTLVSSSPLSFAVPKLTQTLKTLLTLKTLQTIKTLQTL